MWSQRATSQLIVLPGTGTSALAAPRSVMEGQYFTFGSVADMDNDGIRDLVVGQEGESLHVFPGNGDFTFDPPFTFPTAPWPHGATVADLDGDGLRDVVVAHRYATQLTVYRNGGTFAFTATHLPMAHSSTDVTSRDLNGDGKLDLVVSARESYDGPWSDGLVYVFLGNGDGTFGAPATFPTAAGSQSVVVGEFTRDGRLDVATTNRSFAYLDTMCTAYYGADSVSVLPGRGDGTFGASVDFALAPALSYYEGDGFQNMVGTLNTSDLNGDGRTDLITSHGKILLNAAPRANRPPVVSAGEDQTVFNATEVYFPGSAAGDPDHHLLRVNWSQDAPREGNVPLDSCVELPSRSGNYLFYLTASDGHGGVTSDDVTITHVNTEEWPATWASGDVGAVGAAGSSSYDSSTGMFTVRGGGADIWGRADEFHWMHQAWTGDFEMTAQVSSVENIDAWTKAGLMVRDGLGAGARHASLFVTPSTRNGDRVPTTAGRGRAERAHLGSRGDGAGLDPSETHGRCDRSAYRSPTGVRESWSLIDRQTLTALAATVEIGFAVSSHRDSVLAAATFDLTVANTPLWSTEDVGAVGVPGETDFSAFPRITLQGSAPTSGALRTPSLSTAPPGRSTAPSPRASGASRTRMRGRRRASCSGRRWRPGRSM